MTEVVSISFSLLCVLWVNSSSSLLLDVPVGARVCVVRLGAVVCQSSCHLLLLQTFVLQWIVENGYIHIYIYFCFWIDFNNLFCFQLSWSQAGLLSITFLCSEKTQKFSQTQSFPSPTVCFLTDCTFKVPGDLIWLDLHFVWSRFDVLICMFRGSWQFSVYLYSRVNLLSIHSWVFFFRLYISNGWSHQPDCDKEELNACLVLEVTSPTYNNSDHYSQWLRINALIKLQSKCC